MYTLGKKIGKGSYGSVYHVTYEDTPVTSPCSSSSSSDNLECSERFMEVDLPNTPPVPVSGPVGEKKELAMKVFDIVNDRDPVNGAVVKEIAISAVMKHPNVIRSYSVDMDTKRGSAALLSELAEMDLFKYIQTRKYDPLNIFFQIACGLYALHNNGIIHGDLKPANCLFKDGRVMICDLGCFIAPFGYIHLDEVITTVYYRAPEVVLSLKGPDYYENLYSHPVLSLKRITNLYNKNISNKIDIWALGCILAELYNKKPLMCTTNEANLIGEYYMGLIMRTKLGLISHSGFQSHFGKVPLEVQGLLFRMLEIDPADRPSIIEVLNHPLFASLVCPPVPQNVFDIPQKINVTNMETRKAFLTYMSLILQEENVCMSVFFLAVDILDRTQTILNKWENRFFPLGVACISLAEKVLLTRQTNIPKLLKSVADPACDVAYINGLECQIIHILKGIIYRETLFTMYPGISFVSYIYSHPTPDNLDECPC